LGRIILTAKIPDFSRSLLSDDPGKVSAAQSSIKRAHLWASLAEARILSGNSDIAHNVQNVAATNGVTRDHSDDRLVKRADLPLYIQNIGAQSIPGDIAAVTDLEVGARAEGLRSLPGENNNANRGICTTECESIDLFHDGLRPKGVTHLRPVDGDFGNAIFNTLQEQVLVLFNRHPCFHF
jgi:hypothetical protein